jgi:hypothetical protein
LTLVGAVVVIPVNLLVEFKSQVADGIAPPFLK